MAKAKEPEELQLLGFFGILQESYNILSSWRRIFTQITLAIIFPLTFIFLAHIKISFYIFENILQNEITLDLIQYDTNAYSNTSDVLTSEWIFYFIFKVVYFFAFVILSLLSTSAVVYTVACSYSGKEIAFDKVISVIPTVWKRLLITFLWNFVIFFFYNVVAIFSFIPLFICMGSSMVRFLMCFSLVVVYLLGLVYICAVWHLACVVSVLEDLYGNQAMLKSKDLIKGKRKIVMAVFLAYSLIYYGVELLYELYIVLEDSILMKMIFGSGCLGVLSILMLFGLVFQTVIYFICKSYHHENIDKSYLADHLDGYFGDYVPLKSSDVQLKQINR